MVDFARADSSGATLAPPSGACFQGSSWDSANRTHHLTRLCSTLPTRQCEARAFGLADQGYKRGTVNKQAHFTRSKNPNQHGPAEVEPSPKLAISSLASTSRSSPT